MDGEIQGIGYVRVRLAVAALAALLAACAVLNGWPENVLWPHLLVVPAAAAFFAYFGPYIAAIPIALLVNPFLLLEVGRAVFHTLRNRYKKRNNTSQ